MYCILNFEEKNSTYIHINENVNKTARGKRQTLTAVKQHKQANASGLGPKSGYTIYRFLYVYLILLQHSAIDNFFLTTFLSAYQSIKGKQDA